MAFQILCDEFYSKYGNFCLNEEDLFMIIVNIIFVLIIIGFLYKYYLIKSQNENLSCNVNNAFLILEGGNFEEFYQSSGTNIKSNAKKKNSKRNRGGDNTNNSFDFKINSLG